MLVVNSRRTLGNPGFLRSVLEKKALRVASTPDAVLVFLFEIGNHLFESDKPMPLVDVLPLSSQPI